MATLLNKPVVVFRKVDSGGNGYVGYEQITTLDDYMPGPIKTLFLKQQVADDMGDPLIITVTVEPGDKLED